VPAEVNREANTIVPADITAYIPACPSGQLLVGSASTSAPPPREPAQFAPGAEISNSRHLRPAPPAAALLEAPSSCGCGCGAPTPVAKKTDRRSGAVAGQPRRFIRGHAARLRHRLEFADIRADEFWARVQKFEGGCWLHRPIQITVSGRRVLAVHVALLLDRGLPVTPEAVAKLRLRGRCRNRRCVRPDHVVMLVRRESGSMRRAEAIAAARARMAAWKEIKP